MDYLSEEQEKILKPKSGFLGLILAIILILVSIGLFIVFGFFAESVESINLTYLNPFNSTYPNPANPTYART